MHIAVHLVPPGRLVVEIPDGNGFAGSCRGICRAVGSKNGTGPSAGPRALRPFLRGSCGGGRRGRRVCGAGEGRDCPGCVTEYVAASGGGAVVCAFGVDAVAAGAVVALLAGYCDSVKLHAVVELFVTQPLTGIVISAGTPAAEAAVMRPV